MDEEREIFPLLGWTRTKLGSRNSILVSSVGGRDPSSAPFQGAHK